MKSVKWAFEPDKEDNSKETHHHFFVSSIATWRTGYDLAELVRSMKTEGFNFNVFVVPGPESSTYKIAYYTPQVDGTINLGAYVVQDTNKKA
jgi:hypothetical protein